MIRKSFAAGMIGVLTSVQAAIQTNGLWTGHDHCEPGSIGVCYKNGVPTSNIREREFTAAMGVDGNPTNWENNHNIKQIKHYIPDE